MNRNTIAQLHAADSPLLIAIRPDISSGGWHTQGGPTKFSHTTQKESVGFGIRQYDALATSGGAERRTL